MANNTIDKDALLYFDLRFDSLRKEQKEARTEQNVINDKIFDLLREVKQTVDKTHQQACYTNGKVSALENKHINCDGEKSLAILKERDAVKKVEGSKEFKTGNLLLTIASVCGILTGFFVLWNYLNKIGI
jgi:hypothetical protein